jgi:ClpP protease-like protein
VAGAAVVEAHHALRAGLEGQIHFLGEPRLELARVAHELPGPLPLDRQDHFAPHRAIERDRFFTAEDAVGYGLVDRVISSRQPMARRPGYAPAAAMAQV